MEKIERILVSLDQALSTTKKRHIAGGIFMSVSLLFGGLALTVMTLKEKEKKEDEESII